MQITHLYDMVDMLMRNLAKETTELSLSIERFARVCMYLQKHPVQVTACKKKKKKKASNNKSYQERSFQEKI